MLKEIPDSYEDYLKAIYQISKGRKGGWCSNSEISEYLVVTPASVTGMLHKLKKNDLIEWQPRKSLRLTEKGRNIACKVQNNFEVLKNFFSNILKIENGNLVKKLSCEIEHHITPEISEAIQSLIE